MRGRIFSRVLSSSSLSPRLQTCCSFEKGAETSVSPAYHSTVSRLSNLSSSSRLPPADQNFGPCHGTLSSFQPIRCLESFALLLRRMSSLSCSHIEAQRRSFVSTGSTDMGLNKTCWACDHEISSRSGLFCPSCDAIQPLDLSVDHFTIFQIEQSFKVDLKVLEQRYKNLQKKLHPDLMSSKSQNIGGMNTTASSAASPVLDAAVQKEQGFSADQSAHVIQAYYTLLRPLSRARYLLGLYGIRVDEEGTIDEPALLMEIMEIRESLEDVSEAKELQKLRAQNHSRIQDTEKILETSFAAGDLKKAVSWVQRLAYYTKVEEEIVRKL